MYIRQGSDEFRVSFTHAPDGTPMGFVVGTTTYYYVTNLQGDVVALLSPSGNKVVEYTYDAWGNILSITGSLANTIGKWNPLRYRGYVYDDETGLYYLQSRYYNPKIGRFINADSQMSGIGGDLLGYNQFAYCFNNPVNMTDITGDWPGLLSTIIKVTTVVNRIVNACNKRKIDKEIDGIKTKEQATEAINEILSKHSTKSSVTFDLTNDNREPMVEITESFNVDSRYDRQKVSAIIKKTGVTDREIGDMSAEWLGHNLIVPIPAFNESARSVGIDYNGDYRWYIRVGYNVLEFLGWE